MQLKYFEIIGLFDYLDHKISFPIPSGKNSGPSLVILHGQNGIGKTTILRMLDGLLRLDFNIFRLIPFSRCQLLFDSGDSIKVTSEGKKGLDILNVTFRDNKVHLHPSRSGPLNKEEVPLVSNFRKVFFKETEPINFELIDTARLRLFYPEKIVPEQHGEMFPVVTSQQIAYGYVQANPKAKEKEIPQSLASRVARFISDAQVNYRTYFSTDLPGVFPKIIERLTSTEEKTYESANFRSRLIRIREQDISTERLGLESDRWDFDQLVMQMDTIFRRRGVPRQQALTVLDSYIEILESRAAERALVAERLFTFERLVSDFFVGKYITVNPKDGFVITTDSKARLQEHQLSSGEFHLLYLMVESLVTRRIGTVIAIDEPEMSMHIAWQRKLIPALLECASKAEPLFILATHSPDLAASYPESLVQLSTKVVEK